MKAIACKNVSKTFSEFNLKDIDLSIYKGEIVGLVGENGAGKTTLIQCIMHAISPDQGEIFVHGVPNTSDDFLMIKDEIGVVLDETCFPEDLSSTQLGHFMSSCYKNWQPETYHAYLSQFKLTKDEPIKTFSRGMGMKLQLAVALSHQASLLILDEPTSGLDPLVREECLDILMEHTRNENHTVLISSHIVSDLEKICDTIAWIDKGEMIFKTAKDDLISQYGLFRGNKETLLNEQSVGSIVHQVDQPYFTEALIDRKKAQTPLQLEKPSLETIILHLLKERRTCLLRS